MSDRQNILRKTVNQNEIGTESFDSPTRKGYIDPGKHIGCVTPFAAYFLCDSILE